MAVSVSGLSQALLGRAGQGTGKQRCDNTNAFSCGCIMTAPMSRRGHGLSNRWQGFAKGD